MQTQTQTWDRLNVTITCVALALGSLGGCGSNDARPRGNGGTGGEAAGGDGGGGQPTGTGGIGTATGGDRMAGAGTGGSDTGGSGTGGDGTGGGAMDASAGGSGGGNDGSADGAIGPTMGGGCPAGVGFCEDFEGYAMGTVPGAPRWTTSTASNMFMAMEVDTAHAFSGTKSFHIKANVNNAADTHRAAYIASTGGGTAFPNPSFARFMIYQGSWMKGGGAVHGRVLQMGNAAATFNFSPSVWAFEVINDNYATRTGPEPALNKWVCVEAEFGTTSAFWVDGKSLPVPKGGGAPAMLKLGMDTWRTLTAEFWIDDLVVDTKRINCPPAK